ncbi:hypothetical protein NP493_87g02040 [Ridgeia piscesae]|uniref:DUF6729 domain-containing protein n=1 Tax=Ridgeia piscesae TaxID=27915 RepID=A0AAD9P8K8_RIDPI|nr:hypothetical protein NP493_87g02040 [Ridgeia piscesae]
MDCRSSRGTFVAWDLRILDQLPEGVRACFPVVLTYACDWAVLSSLRARTLGNSLHGALQQPAGETVRDINISILSRSKGLYNRVRRVVNVTDIYYLAAEYMDCRSSRGTFVAWDLRILDQLPEGVRACFPVVLTYACDWAVLSSLRARTLGNSLHGASQQPAGGA